MQGINPYAYHGKDIDAYDDSVRLVFQSRMKSKEGRGSKADSTTRDGTKYLHGTNHTRRKIRQM